MRTHENTNVISVGPANWRGLNRGVDPQDVPPGQFFDGKNMTCNWPRVGQVQTRPGLSRVVDRLYSDPFSIMPGARGKTWTPPGLKPADPPKDDGNYSLSIGLSPNSGLYVNDDHPIQTITFYVYGGDDLGITDYDWAFGDGGTQNGSATSVNHDYTAPGSFTVTVSGIGSDGNTYTATFWLGIGRDGGGTIVTTKPAEGELFVNGLKDVVLTAAGNVTLTWNTKNATKILLGTEEVEMAGSRQVAVSAATSWSLYAYGGDGGMAYDMVSATVKPTIPPGMTATLTANGETELVLPAPANVDLAWSTSGATTAQLGPEAVSTSGSKQAYVGEDSEFLLVAKNAEGETAEATATVSVGDPTISAILLVDGSATTPRDVPYGKTVVVSWSVTGADTITLDGQAVLAGNAQNRKITQETTFILEAKTAAGGTKQKSITVRVKDAPEFPADLMEMRILGPDTVESGATFDLTYELWGRRNPTADQERASYTGDLHAELTTPTRVQTTYSMTDPLASETGSSSTGLSVELSDGAVDGSFTMKAWLTAAPNAKAEKKIAVTQPQTSFAVDVMDLSLDEISAAYAVTAAGVPIILKVTAQHPGTEETDPAYAGAARLAATWTAAAPQANNERAEIEFLACVSADSSTLVDLTQEDDPTLIPPEAWELGYALVLAQVYLPAYVPSMPEYLAYQILTFSAEGAE